jgi:hypothetical protein
MAPWAKEVWSSAAADRRGIDALAGGDAPVFPPDEDLLTETLLPRRFDPFPMPFNSASAPFDSGEDPYADDLAQRSAEFARNAAYDVGFDDPTPPQGLPLIGPPPPPAWSPPPLPPVVEQEDPPLAALTLGQRWGEVFGTSEAEVTPELAIPPAEAQEAEESELPQRIPAEPDVPKDIAVPPGAPLEDKAQLSKIRDVLRRDDFPSADRPQAFDVEAILEAVRAVAGVREATMRTTPAGAHHLRLELAEGADPATISRMVARMLQEQMGLDAALTGEPPRIPGQAEPPPAPEPPVVPGPRTGLGAEPPTTPQTWPSPVTDKRETRRRHPVSVPRRQPGELRPSERAAATWRTVAADAEPPAGAQPPSLATDRDQGPRAIIEHVQTSTFGLDATVEVRLNTGTKQAAGVASGPAVDAYVLRLCAAATAAAIDDLLRDGTTTGEPGRCFVEHAALVPMGSCDVAVVVVLLVCGGWVEQLAGSALVSGDPRRAVVRATLSAVNRRLAALLP